MPPISSLRSLEHVFREVDLFQNDQQYRQAIRLLEQAGMSNDDFTTARQIGIKKLLSVIEMARQEPDSIAERLVSSIIGMQSGP